MYLGEDLHKARATILRIFGKICAAPKGRALSIQTYGQWPAALFAHHGQRAHINLIKVGTLLAVELDADKMRIHQRGDLVILKAFMRHDMAPMTRRIADGKQNRHIAAARPVKHGRLPRLPMHRIILVLQKIGAGRRAQPIAREDGIAFIGHVGQVSRNSEQHKVRPEHVG